MIGTPDREKVINGLESIHGVAVGDGEFYVTKCSMGDFNRLLSDALALLKAQEPRVMTLTQVYRLVYGSPYIIEINIPGEEPRLMYGLYSHKGVAGNFTFDTVDRRRNLFDADYGKIWRCWTSRPTDEQREAEPWRS